MVKIKKFFGYFDLEKSLWTIHWIGWPLGLVLGLFLLADVIIAYTKLHVDDDKTFLHGDFFEIYEAENTFDGRKHLFITLLIALITAIMNIITSFLFTQGIEKRNHRLIIPILIADALQTVSFNFVMSVASFYMFLCINTVYEKIQEEKKCNNQNIEEGEVDAERGQTGT